MAFDYSLDYTHLDLRAQPELYRVGVGEQGVLLVEPYKSELLPHWRFRTPALAHDSAEKIYQKYQQAREEPEYIRLKREHQKKYG